MIEHEADHQCHATEAAAEYEQFLRGDAMPSLRHILVMIEEEPHNTAYIRIEIQALLTRLVRTL